MRILPVMSGAQHLEGGLDRRVHVGALSVDAVRAGESLHPLGRSLDALQCLDHELQVFGQVRVVLHPFADPPEAVLESVQRVGDLMGDARHELPDPQELLLLPQLGIGAVHVAADRRSKVDGDPKRAGEGHKTASR